MRMVTLAAALALSAATATAASPTASPVGEWSTGKDGTRVSITQCGAAYCGVPAGGAPVSFNLHTDGPNRWTGAAVSRPAGESHVVSMTLAGEKRLVVKGCLGLFCIEQVWQRVN